MIVGPVRCCVLKYSARDFRGALRESSLSAVVTIVLAALVLAGCSSIDEFSGSKDGRSYPGSRSASSLEESLRDYDLKLPHCALSDVRFWDAPEEDDWGRNLILRISMSVDCLDSFLDMLGMTSDDLTEGLLPPPYWAYDANGHPYGVENYVNLVNSGGAVLPATRRRGMKDLQVYVAVESGSPLIVHVRAIFP